jgi:hypothetical protein
MATGRRGAVPDPHAGEPLVAVVDGPLRGRWYYESDWEGSRNAAERMARYRQPDVPPSDYLGYAPTDDYEPHPTGKYPPGRAWRWKGHPDG